MINQTDFFLAFSLRGLFRGWDSRQCTLAQMSGTLQPLADRLLAVGCPHSTPFLEKSQTASIPGFLPWYYLCTNENKQILWFSRCSVCKCHLKSSLYHKYRCYWSHALQHSHIQVIRVTKLTSFHSQERCWDLEKNVIPELNERLLSSLVQI